MLGLPHSHDHLINWFQSELERRRITPTLEDYQNFIHSLERKRLPASRPEVYAELRAKVAGVLTNLIPFLRCELVKATQEASEHIETFEVEHSKQDLQEAASDASRFPFPILAARMTLASSITISPQLGESILCDVFVEGSIMPKHIYDMLESTRGESLIPKSALSFLNEKKVDVLILDGLLSTNQSYARTSDKVRLAVKELASMRGLLMNACERDGVLLIGGIKSGSTRYFHSYFELTDNLSDEYLFFRLLPYKHRTVSVPIHDSLIKEAKLKGASVNILWGLPQDVRTFYIQTSDNPLTPPLRVEYPESMCNKEDEIAKYVLQTAVLTSDSKFDGLPAVQCMAHRECLITRNIMEEILKDLLHKEGGLIGLKRGYRLR